jgi:hypothetical protein
MIGAERQATAVTVELIARRAEELAARQVSAGANRKAGVTTVFVEFDGHSVEAGLALGAGCRCKGGHEFSMP